MQKIKSNIYFENSDFKHLTTFLKKGKFSKYIILGDTNSIAFCSPLIISKCPLLHEAEIIELEPGEINKTIETTIHIWQILTDLKVDKHSLIINLGGGMISDIGGFVASTFKRGIPFINIPTTLLAMVDASVGGKCGIDFNHIKNHIGTITQANAIFIHIDLLNTLSNAHLKNGMAEVIKIALIADANLVNELKVKKKPLIDVVKIAVALKQKIVSKDPLEKGLRKVLNFGHSIGHAIESTFLNTKKELLHGEAVAIGMLIESLIAKQLRLITIKELATVASLIKPHYNLPKFTKNELLQILSNLKHDKKNMNDKLLFSLIDGIGSCAYNKIVSVYQIEIAFKEYAKYSGKSSK